MPRARDSDCLTVPSAILVPLRRWSLRSVGTKAFFLSGFNALSAPTPKKTTRRTEGERERAKCASSCRGVETSEPVRETERDRGDSSSYAATGLLSGPRSGTSVAAAQEVGSYERKRSREMTCNPIDKSARNDRPYRTRAHAI